MTELRQAEKIGDLFTRLAAVATPLSVLFGSALFIGRALAVGFSTFQFIGFQDVVVSSLLAAPLVFCSVSILFLSRLAGRGTIIGRPEAEFEFIYSRWFTALLFAMLAYSFLTQTALVWSSSLWIGGLLLLYQTQGRVHRKVGNSNYSTEASIFTAAVCTFFMLMLLGFRDTTAAIYDEKFLSEVCTEQCVQANVVLRLNEITIVTIKGEDGVATFIPNDEIKQIKQPFGRASAAAVDLSYVGSWFTRTSVDEGSPEGSAPVPPDQTPPSADSTDR